MLFILLFIIGLVLVMWFEDAVSVAEAIFVILVALATLGLLWITLGGS